MLRLSTAVCLMALTASVSAQPNIEQRAVKFPSGQNSVTLKGTLKGDTTIDYMLTVAAGDRYLVQLQAGGATYFNISAPGADSALFIGSTSGRKFEGGFQNGGEHTIRVYQMRSAARRGTVANYSLTIRRLSGFVAAAGETGPAKYNAKGMTKCSAGNASLGAQCEFRVVRKPGGKAEIWLEKPGAKGRYRVLYFEQGDFTTNDGAKINTRRDGDTFLVQAGNEHYFLPDAMIQGG